MKKSTRDKLAFLVLFIPTLGTLLWGIWWLGRVDSSMAQTNENRDEIIILREDVAYIRGTVDSIANKLGVKKNPQ